MIGLYILTAAMAAAQPAPQPADQVAIFSGGCFWCLEEKFSQVPGVANVETGYVGGTRAQPSYREVSSGETDHILAVRVFFDPTKVTYAQLLQAYWVQIDPTDAGGQFCERGAQHRAAIFPLDKAQAAEAVAARARVEDKLERPLAVEVRNPGIFWPAEAAQQDHAVRNPRRYDFYRRSCRIDDGLRRIWHDIDLGQPG
jgi:peptide-methionine (S)-S-oxide reductase